MTAPTIVDSGRVTGSYSSPSFTFTIPTISSGCDLLVCLFSIGFANTTARDQTPSALTVGGNAMTVAAESYWAHAPTNRHVSLAIAYYKNPSSGSSVDVVYTPTQDFSSNSINMQFYTLTGTDSTTPIGNTGSAGPTDGGDSVTLATTVADSLIVGVGTVPDATNPSNATITWTSPRSKKTKIKDRISRRVLLDSRQRRPAIIRLRGPKPGGTTSSCLPRL